MDKLEIIEIRYLSNSEIHELTNYRLSNEGIKVIRRNCDVIDSKGNYFSSEDLKTQPTIFTLISYSLFCKKYLYKEALKKVSYSYLINILNKLKIN